MEHEKKFKIKALGGLSKTQKSKMDNVQNNSDGMAYISKDAILCIAKVCHQANKAWCETTGDNSQKDWNEAEEWQRDSAIKGVEYRLANPSAGKDAQHNAWMADKVNDGWVFGEVKDAEAKTHPCIVPFEQLPEFQQKKDALFCAIVDSLK